MLNYLKKYVNYGIAYAKLEITDSVSNMIGAGVFGILAGVCGLMILFMGSIAAAYLLSDLLETPGTGFLIVMGFYVLLFVVFILFRKKIKLLLTNNVVEAAMEAMDDPESENYEN